MRATTQAETGDVAPRADVRALWRRHLDLATDLRFRLFVALSALGLIHHELQFILEQQRYGPFLQYMEVLRPFRPTIDWPTQVGVAIHLANLLVASVLVVRPDRALYCLLGILFPLSQLVSPDRIASHSILLGGAAVLVLLLGLGEAIEVAVDIAAYDERPGARERNESPITLHSIERSVRQGIDGARIARPHLVGQESRSSVEREIERLGERAVSGRGHELFEPPVQLGRSPQRTRDRILPRL